MSQENEGRLNRRNFDISFNELYDMYEDKELIIQPEFQRLFRWSEKQQSLLIESLLLDMPVPPIYVDEQEDGSYILVDGLQRISSYLNFRGINLETDDEELPKAKRDLDLKIEEMTDEELQILESYSEEETSTEDEKSKGFKLVGCEILVNLNGKTFDDLSVLERRILKRVFIRVEVLTKDNPKSMKYHMFKRLNSGGSMLSEQELRNSNIRMVDSKFINFINELSKNNDFVNLTENMKSKDIEEMKTAENVLRYFLFKNKFISGDYSKDRFKLDEELTLYLEEVTEKKVEFNYEEEKENFEELVRYLNKQFGSNIFGGVNKTSDRITKSFIQYNYDGFMLYFSEKEKRRDSITLEQITDIKKESVYLGYRTGGIENVKARIAFISSQLGE